MSDLIERATKAVDLFDAICNIHDPVVSAHDRRVRAMAKVLEATPANPAQVTDEPEALRKWREEQLDRVRDGSFLTAAIGAGGQAVAADAETLKARAASVLCEAGALCGWPAPNCNAREGAEALFKAGLLSQPHPADERVEGKPVELTYTNYRGETAKRTITPKRVWFGSTEWHTEPQWLLTAYDHDKQADRDFALCDFGAAALAHPVQPEWRPTHRHVKRGSEYMLLGIGKMQTSNWMDEQWSHEPQSGNPPQRTLDPVDMREVAIYRSEDGKLWVRSREEFEDGRFEALPAAPQPKGE